MKEVKLISMVDFVLEQAKIHKGSRKGLEDYSMTVIQYAKFLKQPLELWMFVPCDDLGNVIKEPKPFDCHSLVEFQKRRNQYQKAKERCLFESSFIDYADGVVWDREGGLGIPLEEMNVESLVSLNINLTPTAIKQLGL